MNRWNCLVLIFMFSCAGVARGQSHSETIARQFLPPGASLAQFIKTNPATGATISRRPAVLTGSVVSPQSKDIVFAYESRSEDLHENALFVALLHREKKQYVELSVLPYYGRFLWSQDFSTVGLRLIPLPDTNRMQAVSVVTAIGASLGAQVDIFVWDTASGLKNVFPANSGAHHVEISAGAKATTVKLDFEKYPGETGAPQPKMFKWNGNSFAKFQ